MPENIVVICREVWWGRILYRSLTSELFVGHAVKHCHEEELVLFHWPMLGINITVLDAFCEFLCYNNFPQIQEVVVDDSAYQSPNKTSFHTAFL